jgi:hypothetical protein
MSPTARPLVVLRTRQAAIAVTVSTVKYATMPHYYEQVGNSHSQAAQPARFTVHSSAQSVYHTAAGRRRVPIGRRPLKGVWEQNATREACFAVTSCQPQ